MHRFFQAQEGEFRSDIDLQGGGHMAKGDARSKRGKINRGSFGRRRPRKERQRKRLLARGF
ncbi:hypothetical protein GCM10027040_04580 [Halomonas shantousis]